MLKYQQITCSNLCSRVASSKYWESSRETLSKRSRISFSLICWASTFSRASRTIPRAIIKTFSAWEERAFILETYYHTIILNYTFFFLLGGEEKNQQQNKPHSNSGDKLYLLHAYPRTHPQYLHRQPKQKKTQFSLYNLTDNVYASYSSIHHLKNSPLSPCLPLSLFPELLELHWFQQILRICPTNSCMLQTLFGGSFFP